MDTTKPFIGINHGLGSIKLTGPIREFLPTEIHLKENGDTEDNPSVAIVMKASDISVVGQLSLKMWNEGLKDIGYKIVKL